MRVLLISANTETLNMRVVPWGLACVAAATRRAGHEVALVDLVADPDPRSTIDQAIAALAPEVIGVSIRNIDDQCRRAPSFLLEKVRLVVGACRAASTAPIVLGGAGYSIFPEQVLKFLGADMGILGEGELAFPELLRCLATGADVGAVPGLVLAGRGLVSPRHLAELDLLPHPDVSDLRRYLPTPESFWLPFQTRRGCAMGCSYCSTGWIEGQSVRRRKPETAVAALAHLRAQGFQRFYFVDNNWNIPASHALELCRALGGLSIEWRCILNPLDVSPALVEAMAEAGCVEVSLGFESGSEATLAGLGKRFSTADICRTSELLARSGIRQLGFLLLGGPGETRQTVQESLAFAEVLGLEAVRVTAGIRLYPHTPLGAIALAEGLIAPDQDLLAPTFYLAPDLAGWIDEFLSRFQATHRGWIL